MTVCVAAIAGGGIVIGAADRLVTFDDIQFEPDQTKIFRLSHAVGVLVAGAATASHEVLMGVDADQKAAGQNLNVAAAAESYRLHYQEAFMRRVENIYLAPLGLTREVWLNQQRLLSPALVRDLRVEISNFDPFPQGLSIARRQGYRRSTMGLKMASGSPASKPAWTYTAGWSQSARRPLRPQLQP